MEPEKQHQLLTSSKLTFLCLSVLLLLGAPVQAQVDTTAEMIKQIEKLGDQNRHHRLTALQSLKHQGSQAVPLLIEALQDSDASVRKGAAFALGAMGADAIEAVPYLLSALKDIDETVRMDVAVALRQIGPSDPSVLTAAINDLITALTDEEIATRKGAAFGLGIIGPEAAPAIPHLIARLKDSDEEVQLSAAIALRRMGQAAVPALTAALTDADLSVRAKATFALGKIHAEIAPNFLDALRKADQSVRQGAGESLEKLLPQEIARGNRPVGNRPVGNRPRPTPSPQPRPRPYPCG